MRITQIKQGVKYFFECLKNASFSVRNRIGVVLAAVTMVTGAFSLPVSAFGVVPGGINTLGQVIEIDVKTAVAIAYPVPENTGMSQGYHALHNGIDITAPLGSEVKAIEAGEVTLIANERGGYGRRVEITHENNKVSLYAHLGKIDVYEGDKVTPETTIGEIGLTGRTTGPHLHLEVRVDGHTINPLVELGDL